MLSDLQTKKLTRYFQVYDIDDDGRIDEVDFDRIVENVRILHGAEARSAGETELEAAYTALWSRLSNSADVDGDGGVNLDEWLAYWQLALESDARHQGEIQALTDRLFAIFDVDEDGSIGAQEFADFYGVFGLPVDLAQTVFDALDTNEDGAISRGELVAISREFYESDDLEAPGNFLFGPYGA